MNKQSVLVYGAFILALAFLVIVLQKKDEQGAASEGAAVAPATAPSQVTVMPDAAEVETPAPAGRRTAMDREPEIAIADEDWTPFLRSAVAEKWMAEFGYSRSDLVRAQRKLRAEHAPDINDPGAIMRALPVRHVGSLSITALDVPSEASAGKPIAFSLSGRAPSPSFVFSRFETLVQGQIIRIRAVGHSEGETTSGPGDVITLKGQLDPLPAGEYRIEIPDLGPAGSFPLVVKP